MGNTPFPGDISPFGANWKPGLEILINNVWTDVTADMSDDGVTIVRGRKNESDVVDPSSMTAVLKNSTGKYTPRNPNSPYYGQIGRNTPVRCYVELGAPWLSLNDTNACITTPDSANTSITGDLELQWDGWCEGWGAGKIDLMSKYGAAGQRSYALQVESTGIISFFWTTDGSTLLSAQSTLPIPSYRKRQAIKVTLDVNNGASGRTITFYTSDSITGTWVQLGDAVVQAGTTSIFDSTSVTTIGKNSNTTALNVEQRVLAAKILQGIGGTVRANLVSANLPVQASGTFSDGIVTWTLSAATITNRHYRFWGEIVGWPQAWGRTGSPSAVVEIECAGVLRRLGQGTKPVQSVMRRAFSALGAECVAYWPCEDASNATSLRRVIGNRNGRIVGEPSLASFDFNGSKPLPALGSGRLIFTSPVFTPNEIAQVRWVGNLPTTLPDNTLYARFRYSGGSIARVDLRWYTASGGQFGFEVYDDENNQVYASLFSSNLSGKRARWTLELSDSGSDVSRTFGYYEQGAATGLTSTVTLTGQTLGRILSADFNPGRVDVGDMAVGHVTFEKAITTLFDVSVDVLNGHNGESAEARVKRLGSQNNLSVTVVGGTGSTEELGAQQIDTAIALIKDAAYTDNGILYEPRNSDDLVFRTLESMYDQTPLSITYTDNLLSPFQPVEDDDLTRNSVTVRRLNGSEATYTDTTSRMGTAVPPTGVGLYDEEVELNLYTDAQLEQHAAWRVNVGTIDEARWPVIGLDLAHPTFRSNATVTRDILWMDLGDRLDVSNIPSWLPPFPVSQITQGYTETIQPHSYTLEWNCTPASIMRAGRYTTTADRYSGDGTTTSGTLTTTATSMTITVPTGVEWTTVDGSYDIYVTGERMTVTNVTGTGPTQTMTVTRSVNGVVKTHAAGEAVSLADPCRYSL